MYCNPKTREEMLYELEDWYSDLIFNMDDDDLRDEYNDRILEPGLSE